MTGGATDREQRAFAAVPTSARVARSFVVDALRRRGADPTIIGDYQLVVSELVANIIEHGDGSDMVVIIADVGPQWWEVEVADGPSFGFGQELRPDSWTVADARQFSGRGLGIVRKLMDDIVIAAADGHVSVRCRRRQHQ